MGLHFYCVHGRVDDPIQLYLIGAFLLRLGYCSLMGYSVNTGASEWMRLYLINEVRMR